MTLKTRLLIIILLATAGSVVVTAGILAAVAGTAMVGQARDDAANAARLIGRIATIAEDMPNRFAARLEHERLGMAYALAQLVAVERANGKGDGDLDRRLRDIAAKASIGEIRILDGQGHTTATSLDEVELPIVDDDVLDASQAFRPLLQRQSRIAAPAGARFAADGRDLAYVGAATSGEPGAVVLGYDTADADALRDQVGLGRILRSLLAGHAADALWVFDDRAKAVEATSIRAPGGGEEPLPREAAMVAAVLQTGNLQSRVGLGDLTVAAPVLDADGIPAGAVLLRVPTTRLVASLETYLLTVVGITAALVLIGVGTARVTAQRISGPITRVTAAAAAIEQRRFDPAWLDPVEQRPDEIGRLARVFRSMAVDLLGSEQRLDGLVRDRTHDLELKNGELQAANHLIEAELEAARHLQAAILPQTFATSPDYACAATMVPATQLAGDFYDFIALAPDRIGILVADVAGKGVPAAFFMGISRTVLQQTAKGGVDAAGCLTAANALLCATNPTDLFVTLFYAVIDLKTGLVTYANGGHNPPFVLRADGTVERLPMAGSPPLGVFEDLFFVDRQLRLLPGDTLVLYTDGVTEAMDLDGDLFGEARLVACLAACTGLDSDSVLARVTGAVGAFVGDAPLSDDLTCLVLRYSRERHSAQAVGAGRGARALSTAHSLPVA